MPRYVHPSECARCRRTDGRSTGPRGTTARREHFCFFKIHLVEGCTVLIKAVPHVHPYDDYSYKVPRRPFESARLDAELKVRNTMFKGHEG